MGGRHIDTSEAHCHPRGSRADSRLPRTDDVDVVVAGALLGVLSPLLAARALTGLARHGRVFDEHRRLGRGGAPVTIRSFAGRVPGRRLAYLLSVARGDLRFVGPRPLHPLDDDVERRRFVVTPGLMSPHRLRARTGIDYDSEAEDIDQSIVSGENLGLTARYVVAELLRGGSRPAPGTLTVLGVELTNTSMEEALDWVFDRASDGMADRVSDRGSDRAGAGGPAFLAFVNPDCLNKAVANRRYRDILVGAADRVLPDGIGIKLAANLQGLDVRENVNGTDMFPRLCARAADSDVPIYLLGARPGVADAVAAEMTRRHPRLRVAGTRDGYFDLEDEPGIVEEINASGARILLVAFGVPRQEFWIARHRGGLTVGVAMGVGGLFDFYSGRIPRAPHWVREMGLEWVWRLAQEPGRMWRRYLVGNPLFLARAWREATGLEPWRREPGERPRLLGYGYYGDNA